MLVIRRQLLAVTRPPTLLAAAALLAYLVAATGLPVPARPGPRAGCCAGACGCPEEEQARAGCCCAPARRAPARLSCCGQAEGQAAPLEQPTVRWVISAQQQKCRGLATVWLSAGAALPPPPPVEVDLEPLATGRMAPTSALARALPSRPPLPPPRLAEPGLTLPPVSTGERSAL